MPTSPLTEDQSLLRLSIQSNGKALDDSIGIISVKTNEWPDRPCTAEIAVAIPGIDIDGFDEKGADVFKAGSLIEISLGYANKVDSVFKGIVVGQVIELEGQAAPSLTIVCRNEMADDSKLAQNLVTEPVLLLTYGTDIISVKLTRYNDAVSVMSRTIGHISFPGSTLAKVNTLAQLSGLGKYFLEDVFISGVEHFVSEGNWTTTATIGIDLPAQGALRAAKV
jgi:hypothetical protein